MSSLAFEAEEERVESERLLDDNEENDKSDESRSDNSIVIDVNDGDEQFFEPEFEVYYKTKAFFFY